jgi:hypothetical protein
MATSRIDTTAPHEPDVPMTLSDSQHTKSPRDPRGRWRLLLIVALATALALAGAAFAVNHYDGNLFTSTGPASALDTHPVVPAVAQAPRPSAAACSGNDRNVVGNNVVVAENEWLCGGASAYGGDVTVLGHVSGNATSVGGDVTVGGEVDGNVTAFGGDITLLPNSLVAGDVQTWGGRIIRAPDAVVQGSVGHVSQPAGMLQPDSWYLFPGHGVPWLNLIFWALASAGIAYFFPTQLLRVRQMAQARLGGSLLVGVAALLIGVAASLVLFVTCVGIPVALLLLLAGWVLSVFGTVALGFWLGELLVRNAAYRQRSSFVVAALVGTLLLALPAEIPCVGGLVRLVVTATGLGAAALTLYYARNALGYGRV